MGTDSHVSRLCSRIEDLANPSQLSKYLKAIEGRDMTTFCPSPRHHDRMKRREQRDRRTRRDLRNGATADRGQRGPRG
jgi:hypothetical protein